MLNFANICSLLRQDKMENKAMYLSTYEERENGTMYEEAYEGHNLSKLHLCDEGKDTWTVANEHINAHQTLFCGRVVAIGMKLSLSVV